jgi:hypothetical protein
MAGAGFHCIANYRAPIPRFATIRITAWQSALKCTADCQPLLSGLLRTLKGSSGPWHSALKFAIRGTAIFFMAIRLEYTAICYYSVTNLSVEFSNRVNSSPRHFTSRNRLIDTSYIFLTGDFASVKLIRGAMYSLKLYCTSVVSVDTLFRDTIHLNFFSTYFVNRNSRAHPPLVKGTGHRGGTG